MPRKDNDTVRGVIGIYDRPSPWRRPGVVAALVAALAALGLAIAWFG